MNGERWPLDDPSAVASLESLKRRDDINFAAAQVRLFPTIFRRAPWAPEARAVISSPALCYHESGSAAR
jgi:hypothetical protein